ncbi:hypothetical protein [uncultured Pseudomonas sp.]|uniref:hypothetical protein n=1 Tax=uncultured Pseudomonas sp. TaxID=114707 RepID=UPI0030DB05DC
MSLNNTYRHTFVAKCPSDGESIIYLLTIHTDRMLPVEHIRAATAQLKNGYHEDIADSLSELLPGDQTLIAKHQGIEIETVRSGK